MAEPTSRRASRLVGETLADRFRIDDILADSVTYVLCRAFDEAAQAKVAIRLFFSDAAVQGDLKDMLERERVVGARVEHPNIASARAFIALPDGTELVILPDLGPSLRQVMTTTPMPLARAARITRQIALALGALHELGVVYRALSPDVVHFAPDAGHSDVVKLTDFRFAQIPRDLSENVARKAPPLSPSSPASLYAAPDLSLREGREVDPSADFYALGLLFYELTTGARPAARESLLPEMTSIHSIALSVEAVATQMIAKDPGQRASVAIEVARALDALAEPVPSTRKTLPSAPDMSPAPIVVRSASLTPESAATLSRTSLGTADTIMGVPAAKEGTSSPSRLGFRPSVKHLAIAGAAIPLLLTIIVLAVRSGDSSTDESPATGTPSLDSSSKPAASTKAATSGQSAESLASTRDLRARLTKSLRAGSVKSYVDTLEQVLSQDPMAAEDREVINGVIEMLMKIARSAGPESDRLFEIIEHKMGTSGPDLLYELMTTRGGSRAAERATDLLKREELRSRGTPAMRIAYDLRMARRCEEKVALLDRAKDDGDKRTLGQLQELNKSCGRGTGECCLRDEPKFKEALSSIRERLR